MSTPSETFWGRAWLRSLPGVGAALVFALIVLAVGPAQAQAPAAAPVRVGEAVAFSLSADVPGRPARERAARASAALALVLQKAEPGEVRVQRTGDTALVQVGETPIVELTAEDAQLAGEPSLDTYANERANTLRLALASERKRSRIAETVFSCSLVVFFALIAFFLLKQVTSLADRARLWLDEHGDKNLAVSVKRIEIVRPAVVKSSAVIALGLAKWVGKFGIFYAWLVIVLSLFEATRGYTERLTGFVISPLSMLMGRTLAALPLLVVAGFAALAVFVLLRFTGLFLASVARRETHLGWLPADLAGPASVILRIGIVVGALVFAAPVVTGSSDDSLGRTGTIVLWAIGLAATPLLATGLLGAAVLFDRRLSVGDHVCIKGQLGRVSSINLLELRLVTPTGSEWRVPHLLLLASTLERLGPTPRVSVEVLVARAIHPTRVLEVLVAAGTAADRNPVAEIAEVESSHIRYRLTATLASLSERSALLRAVMEALAASGMNGPEAVGTRAEAEAGRRG